MDKKSPIIKTIRRQKDVTSDVLVQKKGNPASAESFFSAQESGLSESYRQGETISWKSFCGVVGSGIIADRHQSVTGALIVRITHPPPADWRKAGVPANPGDSCVVFDWQIVERTHI